MAHDVLRTRLTNGKFASIVLPQDMSAEDWRLLFEYVALQEASFDDDDWDDRPVEEQVTEILARYAPPPALSTEDEK